MLRISAYLELDASLTINNNKFSIFYLFDFNLKCPVAYLAFADIGLHRALVQDLTQATYVASNRHTLTILKTFLSLILLK